MKAWIKFFKDTFPYNVFILAIIFGVGYYEYAMWKECLSDHSVWYCMRVLSN